MTTFKVPEGTKEVKVSESEGRIVIEFIPEKVEFNPKIGDIIAHEYRRYDYPLVVIFDGTYGEDKFTGLDFDGNLCFDISLYYHEKENNRLATEEEKALLFSALDREGYVWNAEAKKVEKKRWRANMQGWFYHFDLNGVDSLVECKSGLCDRLYDSGNYFRTKQQAEEAQQKVKELLLSLHS